VDDEQIRSECAGLIWLAVNWDHKQTIAIMVMNCWVSQNKGKVLHQMSNGSTAILIFCIMILGAVKLQASQTRQ
jgi:glutamine amidotransferase PdxT